MKKLSSFRSMSMIAVFLTALLFQVGCSKSDDEPPVDQTKPTVITSTVINITATTAVSGGIISAKGGTDVTAKGVCWGTSENPDTTGFHTHDGTGTAAFTSNLTDLTQNTTYFIRAYATNKGGTAYGATLTFTTLASHFLCGDSLIYEGKTYHTVLISTQCWFKNNLNVGLLINGSQNQTNNGILEKHCYNDEESNCDFYGALYQWDEMMQYVTTKGARGICPAEWHLPSDFDWTILTDYLGGEAVAGGKMKEAGLNNWATPNAEATNSSRFTAFAGGSHTADGFDKVMLLAFFGSSSEETAGPGYAWSRVLYNTTGEVYRGAVDKTNSISVRCIKD